MSFRMTLEPKCVFMSNSMLIITECLPLKLYFGGHQVDVLEALDQWYGPDYRYIKVRGHDGGLYILRFDEPHAEWELTMFVSARARLRMA